MSEKPASTLSGLVAVATLSALATWASTLPALAALRISPLIVGILLGVAVGNALGDRLPGSWAPGIQLSAKRLLRAAIVLFGFRITFTQIGDLGVEGVLLDLFIVVSTLVIGIFLGTRVLGVDRETAVMASCGAAICGAAAVIAAEPVVRAQPHKTAVAIGTVVLFGTLAMFLYPALYHAGLLSMGEEVFGVYIGATVHEVAHVVGAGAAVSDATADTAVIVKMTRVMLLAPTLMGLSWWLRRTSAKAPESSPVMIPWFAVGFVGVAGFNSLELLPGAAVSAIIRVDTFLLTMAMTALGLGTVASKIKGVGWAPLRLAAALFAWLVVGGYFATRWLVH